MVTKENSTIPKIVGSPHPICAARPFGAARPVGPRKLHLADSRVPITLHLRLYVVGRKFRAAFRPRVLVHMIFGLFQPGLDLRLDLCKVRVNPVTP